MPLLNCYKKSVPQVAQTDLLSPLPVRGLEILKVIFEVDPVTGHPRNDLSLINKPLPPEVSTVLGQLHQQIFSRDSFSSDNDALGALIPRAFQDTDVLKSYFKNIGLDDDVMSRVLNGDSVSEILHDVNESNDD